MKIFISYVQEDKTYKDELLKRLKPFERQGKIKCWDDELISPGENRTECIINAIKECELVLFLVSPDFFNSDHINNIEKKIALERNEEGKIHIVPVILRHCTLAGSGLNKFQALPKNGKILSTWESFDEGLFLVVEEIINLVKVQEAKVIEKIQTKWALGLKDAFPKDCKLLNDKPSAIFQHYGWLIEIFLQKMSTAVGRERNLRRLSFMTEVFHSSLRYLCFIQIAQVLKNSRKKEIPIPTIITNFFILNKKELAAFEWLDFLKNNDFIKNGENFMPEIPNLIKNLKQPKNDLNRSVLFLLEKRLQLLNGELKVDEHLNQLLNEYLNELGCWLKEIAFLADYRLASIKEINLHYWPGSAKNFVHTYGELHGVYNQHNSEQKDLMTESIEDVFTYSRSVLLFKGNNIADCLNQIEGNTQEENKRYLSLSPLIIDHSVLVEKEDTVKQTPEIYYYAGNERNSYHFDYHKNELVYKKNEIPDSNNSIAVENQNKDQPKFDELFVHLDQILQRIKVVQYERK